MYERTLERFRRRHNSHPSAEVLDRRLFLPFADFLKGCDPDPDTIAKTVCRTDAKRLSFAELAFRAHVRSAVERFSKESGVIGRMGETYFEFSYDGKAIPVLLAASMHHANKAKDRCLEAEYAYGPPVYFCRVTCGSGFNTLISPDTIDGRFDMRVISLPNQDLFENIGRALERSELGQTDIFEKIFYEPLMGFFAKGHRPNMEQLEEMALIARDTLGRGLDASNYLGFALEAYIRSRLTEFAKGNAFFSMNKIRWGSLPGDIIYQGDGNGGVVFLDPNKDRRKELAEVDALGEITINDKVTPVVFEVKTKPFSKLFPKKRGRVVGKNFAKARWVERIYSAKPHICIIHPDQTTFMKRYAGFRVLGVQGIDWLGDVACRIRADY